MVQHSRRTKRVSTTAPTTLPTTAAMITPVETDEGPSPSLDGRLGLGGGGRGDGGGDDGASTFTAVPVMPYLDANVSEPEPGTAAKASSGLVETCVYYTENMCDGPSLYHNMCMCRGIKQPQPTNLRSPTPQVQARPFLLLAHPHNTPIHTRMHSHTHTRTHTHTHAPYHTTPRLTCATAAMNCSTA